MIGPRARPHPSIQNRRAPLLSYRPHSTNVRSRTRVACGFACSARAGDTACRGPGRGHARPDVALRSRSGGDDLPRAASPGPSASPIRADRKRSPRQWPFQEVCRHARRLQHQLLVRPYRPPHLRPEHQPPSDEVGLGDDDRADRHPRGRPGYRLHGAGRVHGARLDARCPGCTARIVGKAGSAVPIVTRCQPYGHSAPYPLAKHETSL